MTTIIIDYRCGHRLDNHGYVGPEATADHVTHTAMRCPECREDQPRGEYLGAALSFARPTLAACVACGATDSPDNRLEYIDDFTGESGWLCCDDDACVARMRGDGEDSPGVQYDSEVPW